MGEVMNSKCHRNMTLGYQTDSGSNCVFGVIRDLDNLALPIFFELFGAERCISINVIGPEILKLERGRRSISSVFVSSGDIEELS